MQYQIKTILTTKEISAVKKLLKSQNLKYESSVDYTIGIYDEGVLIATGSIFKNVIKMVAVEENRHGENLTALVLTHLILKLSESEVYKYFIFTSPENLQYFIDFSFKLVAMTDKVALLENNIYPIEERLIDLKQTFQTKEMVAAIVMNCNPITNGHLYLIEKAAKENNHVIIFLVEEDQSVFPFKTRLELVSKSIKHLKNVQVVPSTPYIISNATFPTYFLKKLNDVAKQQMILDVTIFKKYFIPICGIQKRYVGSEPTDETTEAYNQTMKSLIKDQLVIVDRIAHQGKIISASYVRMLAKEKKFDFIKPLVPRATYQFLKSKKGVKLFEV
jgi:[citrate (pro-3S)-lyase] ligase